MRISNSADVIARLKLITATTTDSALAERLGISPQTLSSWKGRKRIPYAVCIDLAEARDISLDWLLGGAGPMQRACAQGPSPSAAEAQLLAVFRALGSEDQTFIQHAAEERKRIRELERRLDELDRRNAPPHLG